MEHGLARIGTDAHGCGRLSPLTNPRLSVASALIRVPSLPPMAHGLARIGTDAHGCGCVPLPRAYGTRIGADRDGCPRLRSLVTTDKSALIRRTRAQPCPMSTDRDGCPRLRLRSTSSRLWHTDWRGSGRMPTVAVACHLRQIRAYPSHPCSSVSYHSRLWHTDWRGSGRMSTDAVACHPRQIRAYPSHPCPSVSYEHGSGRMPAGRGACYTGRLMSLPGDLQCAAHQRIAEIDATLL
ncbi:MAG: hypothetical protein KatS3mg058_2791 [Roseiflexus sp.]|nr:MAG: hypothetical protein KatS3mg058_2791 [Roseiflexus sp.]